MLLTVAAVAAQRSNKGYSNTYTHGHSSATQTLGKVQIQHLSRPRPNATIGCCGMFTVLRMWNKNKVYKV